MKNLLSAFGDAAAKPVAFITSSRLAGTTVAPHLSLAPSAARKLSVSVVRLQLAPPGKGKATLGPGAVGVGEGQPDIPAAYITDVDHFDDDVEQLNIEKADQKFRNRQARKGESAELSDIAFDDSVERHHIDKADQKYLNRQARKGDSAILSDQAFDDEVEQLNIESAEQRVARRRAQGMQVADLSDHDMIDDPVEMANIEKAEENKKRQKEWEMTVEGHYNLQE